MLACPAEFCERACAGGFSSSRTSRRRTFCDGYARGASSRCAAASFSSCITYTTIDSLLAKHDDGHPGRARIALSASSSDQKDGAAVAASPGTTWGGTEELVKGEFSVAGSSKVVSWCPSLGDKVGYEDPPTKKRLCGGGDPTEHIDYGLLVAQANFRAHNEAYTLFRQAWGARGGADLTVVPSAIKASTPQACQHFAKSLGLSTDAAAELARNLKSILKPAPRNAMPCYRDKTRFIGDTGSGHHIVRRAMVKKADAMKHVRELDYALTLSTAGGSVAPDGVVEVDAPILDEGSVEALVLPNSPHVISIGALCQGRGYAFHWPKWSRHPYLVSPSGKIIYLEVDGYIPYLYLDDDIDIGPYRESALPASADDPPGAERSSPLFFYPEVGATRFLADFEAVQGPPLWACTRRLTVEMHKKHVLGDREIQPTDTVESLVGDFPDGARHDIITYIEYDPDKIKFFGLGDWRDPNSDAGGDGQAGIPPAGDEPTSRVIQPADQPEAYHLEGDEGELAAQGEAPESRADRLRREAVSPEHMADHLPKNPYCWVCNRAKARQLQQRSKDNKKITEIELSLKPRRFAESNTCDHWIAANELSRGIDGETVGLSYRDLATAWLDGA